MAGSPGTLPRGDCCLDEAEYVRGQCGEKTRVWRKEGHLTEGRGSRGQEMPLEKGQKARAVPGGGEREQLAPRPRGRAWPSARGPGQLAARGVGAGEDLLSSPSPNPKSGSSLCTLGLGLRFLSKLGSPCGCR